MVRRLRAAHAHLALLGGEQETALAWATASGLGTDDAVTFLHEREYLTLARVYIAQGRRDPRGPWLDDARRLLDRWLHAATDGERWGSVIELLILRALLLAAQGDEHAALVALDHALDRAAPEGYVRIFVDEGAPMRALLSKLKTAGAPRTTIYHDTLLAAFSADLPTHIAPAAPHEPASPTSANPSSVPPMAEALTEREMHVLRLLAAGASNRAIADHLVISLPTAKKHVTNILGKLDAHNRTAAVARARALHLL
jgi:LuxR family maltose regulon positive regulatory protein